jgi:CubicO group peptidase (beta-lactamase class C family)
MDQTRILMRARLVAVGLLVALIVTSGCGGGQAHSLEAAPPAEHGLPADLPKRIDAYVHEHAPDLNAVLVVADDRLVAERYYGGVTRDRFLQLYSATKSVTGLLVGIALADGKLTSIDETLAEALPLDLLAGADRRFRSMTLRQLLSMTTGLGETLSWMTSADWSRDIVEHPFFAGTPGSFAYSSEGSQLLSAVLEHAVGKSLLAYGKERLFEPLGIVTQPVGSGPLSAEPEPTFSWLHDRRGHYMGGSGLRLRGVDMAKLGLFYLHRGEWEGRRLVPRSWIDASTRPSSSGGLPEGDPHGFHIWLPREHGRRAFLMAGFGGQYIEIVPSLRLVMVTSSPARPSFAARGVLTYIVGLAEMG